MVDISCRDIFKELPNHFLPEKAKGFAAIVQFNISGKNGGNWYVTVKNRKCTVKQGKTKERDATVITDDKTYVKLSLGRLKGELAVMFGKLKIAGDFRAVIKLNSLFDRSALKHII